jgi:hypothetical protein
LFLNHVKKLNTIKAINTNTVNIKPIVESLTTNYSNDYAISKQVQLLYKTSKEIEVFINSLISRHSWLDRLYIGFNGIKKLTRLGKTDEEKINSFKTTINYHVCNQRRLYLVYAILFHCSYDRRANFQVSSSS